MTDKMNWMKWTAAEWEARAQKLRMRALEADVEWISAGYVRSKRTGRWHAVVKYDDEVVVSERSFETREDVLEYLKDVTERAGGRYRPIQ